MPNDPVEAAKEPAKKPAAAGKAGSSKAAPPSPPPPREPDRSRPLDPPAMAPAQPEYLKTYRVKRELVASINGNMTTLPSGQVVSYMTHGENTVRRLLEHHKDALELAE